MSCTVTLLRRARGDQNVWELEPAPPVRSCTVTPPPVLYTTVVMGEGGLTSLRRGSVVSIAVQWSVV